MSDDPRLVGLLKFYKKKATVTRPEVGILTGKSVGQIAGVCNRAEIIGWPKIKPDIKRLCQFPVLKDGKRQVCGLMQSKPNTLCCSKHEGKVWDPDSEDVNGDAVAEVVAEPVIETVPEVVAVAVTNDTALVELVKFYWAQGTVTQAEVGILTDKTPEQIEEIRQRHDLKPWPAITQFIVRDRPCQFPVLRQTGRYMCGHLRSLAIDADPLCCSDHRGLVWNPAKDK